MSTAQQVKLARALRVSDAAAAALVRAGLHTPRIVCEADDAQINKIADLAQWERDLIRGRKDAVRARVVSHETRA